jgi:hypothetical protein
VIVTETIDVLMKQVVASCQSGIQQVWVDFSLSQRVMTDTAGLVECTTVVFKKVMDEVFIFPGDWMCKALILMFSTKFAQSKMTFWMEFYMWHLLQ